MEEGTADIGSVPLCLPLDGPSSSDEWISMEVTGRGRVLVD